MTDALPHPEREWVRSVRRLVIKIGSSSLVDESNRLDLPQIRALADQMASLQKSGIEVICVSSGAVAAGLSSLGFPRRPIDLPSLQAAASAGQARLIGLYRDVFAQHDLAIGQVLLSHADLRSRERHLNARNTLNTLLQRGAVPIINENDTVAVDEIRFGDNDVLSALVACLARADLLILLTSADGFLSAAPVAKPPRNAPSNHAGHVIPLVDQITPDIRALAGESTSSIATGGMRSKLKAAEMLTRAGERAIIAGGRTENIITRLMAGERLGTLFQPQPARMRGRQRWIAFFDHPKGDLHLDAGAVAAIRERGGSLLAIGITGVTGSFTRGAPVRLLDPAGNEVARGLVNYPADELELIRGNKSDQIESILGKREYDEVVHRDNLTLLR
jgi:glutamate 5-kinase